MDDTLNDILQVAPDVTRDAVVVTDPPESSENTALVPAAPLALAKPDPHAEDLNDDVDYAREQIKQLIDDGRSAINGAMELASSSDKPSGYRVVGELITAVTSAAKDLVTIHKVRKETLKTDKEAKQVDTNSGGNVINIDKAVFAGRASDLLRELQQVKKQQIKEDAAVAVTTKSDTSDASES